MTPRRRLTTRMPSSSAFAAARFASVFDDFQGAEDYEAFFASIEDPKR